MKKTKKNKKSLDENEIKKIAEKAGFVFVVNAKISVGKPDNQLNKETIIYNDGSKKGFKVKL